MDADSRKQSLRAVLTVAATIAILVSLRSIYQEMRHQDEVESARLMEREEAPRPADWEQQVERARKSVQGQLEAFKAGNWEKAFTFAAGSFHESMQVADFRRMVEGGYPQIARPRDIQVGTGRWAGGGVEVDTTVTGKDDVTVRCVYQLGQEKGEWKVTGVMGGASPAPSPGEVAPAPEAPPRAAPPAGAA
jgi:hypothetical protein